jgi:protocatechuate 3,4-dioxygenase beta subunit
MQRRNFIKKSSLMAFSVSAFGGIHWNGLNFVGDSPTTTDILGPFYRPGAPMRSNIISPGSTGIPMNLSGKVFSENGKTPLDNALVEIWQCDEKEYYDNASDDYSFRGAVMSDKNGSYHFKTIVPVPYKANPDNEDSWRPAHIHMRVSVPNQQDLITQIYFKGDQYLDNDTWASAPRAINRTLEIVKNDKGESEVTFDIVMSKEFPLDSKVYDKITGLYKMEDKSNVEFIKSDDLLFLKRNGHLLEGLRYIGNNTFEGGVGYPKVSFELLEKGGTKAVISLPNKSVSGEKFLKYKES